MPKQEYKCAWCGKSVIRWAKNPYLRTNPDNLALLCMDCHLFVHSKKNVNREFMLKKGTLPDWLYEGVKK